MGAVVQKNLTQTRQRQATCHHLQHTGQVKGKSNASNSIYLRDIRIVRILSGAILVGCCVREVITFGSSSIEVTLGIASWEVGTLVLDDLLKYIVKDRFGIIGVFNLWADTENVSAFSYVVLNVIVCALIGKLGHFDSKGSSRLGWIELLTFLRRTVHLDRRGPGWVVVNPWYRAEKQLLKVMALAFQTAEGLA